MAEKKPQPEAPDAGGKAKSRLTFYLPLIIIVVLAPAAAWLTLRIVSKGSQKHAAAAPSVSHESGAKEPETKAKTKSEPELYKPGQSVTVPLTRDPVGFHKKKYLGRLAVIDVNGDALREAQAEKIIANILDGGGGQLVVGYLSMRGNHPELLPRVNMNRHRLLEIASDTLGSKSLRDLEKPGFTNVLSSELVYAFNEVLGPGTLQEVNFIEFDVRAR